MTRRIPHSQDYTFVVSLLRKLCSRSTVVGPWELRAIQRTTLRFSCFPTHGNLGFPHFHLMILFHVVHSDIQHHLEASQQGTTQTGQQAPWQNAWNCGSLYVDATFLKKWLRTYKSTIDFVTQNQPVSKLRPKIFVPQTFCFQERPSFKPIQVL